VKHQDFCVSEFDENELETERQNHKLETLEAKIAELESEIKGLTTDIATLKADVADLQVQLQTAGEERQAANLVFQKTLREQRTTRTALKEAYDVLASVFLKRSAQATAKANAEGAALLQEEPEVAKTVDQLGAAEANVAPAPEFEAYKQHEGKNHVLVAIEKLIGETKVVEDGSNHDEQEAQKAYEKLVSDTNDSVEAKTRMIADKSEELAKTKQQKAMTSADRDQTIKDLEALGETKAALHQQCDFLMKNFEARQSARAAEIEGLGTVKAILSGMQGDSRGPE
jgi:outer membrane murein-binding lipoprotein Lpp